MKLLVVSALMILVVGEQRLVAEEKVASDTSFRPPDSFLKLFAESAFPAKAPDESGARYRFIYWPTFSQPHLVRLDVVGKSSGVLLVKRLSGKGGYDPGELDLVRTRKVRGNDFKDLLRILRTPKAHKPYGDLSAKQVSELEGLDGAGWYLEKVSRDGYTSTYAWAPKYVMELKPDVVEQFGKEYEQLDLHPFVTACEALLTAARLQFDEDGHSLTKRRAANKAQK